MFGFSLKPLFIRLFFVALLTRFSAILLAAMERRTYYPLGRTKRPVPMTGNGLAAILLCMLGVSQAVFFTCLGRWICCQNGCFARFVGCRHCSFCRRCAVRIAAAGNCAQGISQLASVAGRSPQKEKGSLIRLPLLLTISPFDLTRKPN